VKDNSPYYEPVPENELLTPTGVLVLDADKYADFLMGDGLLNKVVTPEEGLYLPWSVKPFLPAGVYYPAGRYGDELLAITSLDALLDIDCPVVHEKYPKRIIQHTVIKKYKKLLRKQPPYNISAVKLIFAFVVATIRGLAPVNSYHVGRFPTIEDCLDEQYHTVEVSDTIECALDSLYLALREFVGRDTWHLYDMKLVGTSIVIEKLIDYRVFDWYRIQREGCESYDD
jgi:hypothetical protein